MKPSSPEGSRMRAVAAACLFALCILLVISSFESSAAEKVKQTAVADGETDIGINTDAKLKSVAALTGQYTLNQYIYPGSTTFGNLSPTLSPSLAPINSWSIGVPVLYVFTIGNSDLTQTALVDVTLNIALNPPTQNSNFVVLNVKCDAANGAACPLPASLPQANAPLPLTIPQLMIKGGGANDIVIRVLGYYTAASNYQSTCSVSETANPTPTVSGPPKNLNITNDWSVIDLGVTKKSSTTSTSFSATSAATIHYKLTFKGDSAEDFYPPGNALKITDSLIANDTTPLPTYTIQPSTVQITSISGSTLPAGLVLSNVTATAFGSASYASTSLTWPSGSVIKRGDVITIEFDVQVKTGGLCGNSSLEIQNKAFIVMNGFNYSDSIVTNNSAATTPADSFSTGLQSCVAGTIAKKRVCPVTGCPPVNWGDTVTYQIDVTNNRTTTQMFQVRDNVAKQSITVPLKATLSPNSLATDVHCSPSTAGCNTTPPNILPVNVIADWQNFYQLFQTDFTLQPKGSAGDSVSLVFDVKIDKLTNCETDPLNSFSNFATLWEAVAQGPTTSLAYVSTTAAVTVDVLPNLPLCKLKATKIMTQPASGVIIFGQPVSYSITFQNLDSQPITVRTLRDYLNMGDINSQPYGDVPITNLTASCTSTTGVSPMPIYQPSWTPISLSNPNWEGSVVIQEPASGITFPANSQLQCTVSFTPHEPSSTDNICKGAGKPEILNSVFFDQSGLFYTGVQPSAPFFSQVAAPLPLCRRVSVLKSVIGPASTGPNGVLTFQIAITNQGDDPVSYFHLSDPLPSGFTFVALNCASCTSPSGYNSSSNSIEEDFNPIPGASQSPLNTVTLTFQVHASPAGGTYVNTATGSFGAGPPGTNFYFEGDPAKLLVNSAQVQVLTPTLAKQFGAATIGPGGTTSLTFDITNTNSDPQQMGMSFSDTLPAGLQILSAPPPTNSCGGGVNVSPDGQTLTLSGGELIGSNADGSGKHSCQIVVTVKATGACGVFPNNKNNLSQVANLDVSHVDQHLDVIGCQNLPPILSKVFDPPQIPANGTSTLSFNITNRTGDPKQTGISFSDTLPIGLQFLSVLTSDCGTVTISPDGRTITLAGGSLVGTNPDGSGKHSCHITVTVKASDVCGVFQNNKTNFSNVNNLDISGVNQQLEVTGCKQLALCSVKTEQISCKANGSGGYLYTFTVTNNTGSTVTDILLTPLSGSSLIIAPQQPQLPVGGLANGASLTLQATLNGLQPKQSACFDVTLMTKNGSCCTVQVCPVLPDCCASIDSNFKCDAKGVYSGAITITNTSTSVIKNIYLYPPPGVTMSQTYFAVTLAPGQSFDTPPIMISGAKPGKLCFRISLHTADMKECCAIEQCIVLPDCGIQKGRISSMFFDNIDVVGALRNHEPVIDLMIQP